MFKVGDVVHPKKRELSQHVGTITGSTKNDKGKNVWKVSFHDGVDRGTFSGQQILLHEGSSTTPVASEGGNRIRGDDEWTCQNDTTIFQEIALSQEQIDAAVSEETPKPPPQSYKQLCVGSRVKLKSQKYGANSAASIILSVAKHQWLLKFDDGRKPSLYKSKQLLFLNREDDPRRNVFYSESVSHADETEPETEPPTGGVDDQDVHDDSSDSDDGSASLDDSASDNLSQNDVLDDTNDRRRQWDDSSMLGDDFPQQFEEEEEDDDDDDDTDGDYYSDEDEEDGYVEDSILGEEAEDQALRSRVAQSLRVDADEAEDLIVEPPDDDNRIDDPARFGFDPAETTETRRLRERNYQIARENEIGSIIRVKWSATGASENMVEWKVVSDSRPHASLQDFEEVGFVDFDPNTFDVADIFCKLWPGDWRAHHRNLVYWIGKFNSGGTARTVRLPTQKEFIQMIACIITAAGYEERGESLWKCTHQGYPSVFSGSNQAMESIGLSYDRFKQLKKYFPFAFIPENVDRSDPWWQIRDMVNGFNTARDLYVMACIRKLLDESMSPFDPQTTKTGGLAHISFVPRKPRPLGTEMKASACAETKMMLGLEIQEGKLPMQALGPHRLTSTAACTHRLMKLTENCGQQGRERPNLFYGDAWFGTLACLCNVKKQGHEGIFAIKTGSSGIPKKHFENLMKNFPAGAHMVCEAKVTFEGEEMIVVYIAYKYNNRKVLHFAMTKNAGSTVPDPNRPYHARFKDPNGNMTRRDIPRPAVLSDYFRNSPTIDVHNQLRQGSLGLEDAWVTQDPWFRLNTTIIGMTFVDTKQAIQYHVGGNHPLASLTTVQFAGVIVQAILEMPLSDEVRPAISTARSVPEAIHVGVQSPMSAVTMEPVLKSFIVTVPVGAPVIPEWYREQHRVCKYAAQNGAEDPTKTRTIRKRCGQRGCTAKTSFFCVSCQKSFCKDGTNGRLCFYIHLCESFVNSGMQSPDSQFVTSYKEWSKANGNNNL